MHSMAKRFGRPQKCLLITSLSTIWTSHRRIEAICGRSRNIIEKIFAIFSCSFTFLSSDGIIAPEKATLHSFLDVFSTTLLKLVKVVKRFLTYHTQANLFFPSISKEGFALHNLLYSIITLSQVSALQALSPFIASTFKLF
jgi:hypothetical protein